MAFWNKKTSEFETMEEILDDHPGITAAELARKLDIPKSTVLRRLPSMNDAGYLLSEDEKGGLWPFGRRK